MTDTPNLEWNDWQVAWRSDSPATATRAHHARRGAPAPADPPPQGGLGVHGARRLRRDRPVRHRLSMR